MDDLKEMKSGDGKCRHQQMRKDMAVRIFSENSFRPLEKQSVGLRMSW